MRKCAPARFRTELKPLRFAIAIAAAAFVGISCGDVRGDDAAVRYVPVEADFRKVFDSDATNRQKQGWGDYWSWVNQFYRGNAFSQGWLKQSEQLTKSVRDEKSRNKVQDTLNELGRQVAGEWSKDNGVRRISTGDLSGYGNRLRAAQKRDDGSGQAIQAELDALLEAVTQRLQR